MTPTEALQLVSLPPNWNQGKAENVTSSSNKGVSLPPNWNQGKASIRRPNNGLKFLCPRIGIKAKQRPRCIQSGIEFLCPRIGIKAKLGEELLTLGLEFLCPRIGIKAKLLVGIGVALGSFSAPELESRQSRSLPAVGRFLVSLPPNWNQGKAAQPCASCAFCGKSCIGFSIKEPETSSDEWLWIWWL